MRFLENSRGNGAGAYSYVVALSDLARLIEFRHTKSNYVSTYKIEFIIG